MATVSALPALLMPFGKIKFPIIKKNNECHKFDFEKSYKFAGNN